MLIRTEAPADILSVEKLLQTTFDTDAEANLVMSLRENGNRTLSLVACNDEGDVVGYVLFSPVTVNGEEKNWQGLAPLAVANAYRNQGIAAQLVEEGLASLHEFGYPACVVLGDPNYYGRFGFESAEKHQLHCRWEVPAGAFQVIELAAGEVQGAQGLVDYSPEFTAL